jgi:hypothetical protein
MQNGNDGLSIVFGVSDLLVEPEMEMVDTYARPHDPNDSRSSILDNNGEEKRCQRTK